MSSNAKERTPPNSASRGADELVEQPDVGRRFSTERRVSIDDAAPTGRMEFDAIARFLQDVGNEDTDDAGLAELGLAWVARKATIEVHTPATAREMLQMTTWCSGTGRRWAERRTTLRGEHGAHVEGVAVWVHLDPTSGRPVPWGDAFATNYLEATQGRQVDSKLRHDKTPPDVPGMEWQFRQTDMDGFGHVNNAAYLSIAEELLDLDGTRRVEIEWRGPSVASEPLLVTRASTEALDQLWISSDAGDLRATITASTITKR